MWRRACPWLTAVLAVRVALMWWRLREAEAELERMYAAASTPAPPAAEATAAEPETTADGAAASGGGETTEMAAGASDMSSEWEQAVPPMDS